MALSRKHYREIADILRDLPKIAPEVEPSTLETLQRELAREMADYFKRDNSNFKRDRFYDAVGDLGTERPETRDQREKREESCC